MSLITLQCRKELEAANSAGILVASTAAIIGTLAAWPWSMVSAFAAIAALGTVLHVNIIRPIRRRRKLKRPVKAVFIITKKDHHGCDFAVQDDKEHHLRTIILPSNSEVIVDFRFQPRLFFTSTEVSFGCEGDIAKIPQATEYLNRFIEVGDGKHVIPGSGNRHYIDKHRFYHFREGSKQWSRGTFGAMAFKFKTKMPGRYPLDIYFMGDEVEGKSSDLTIVVKDNPTTTSMRCVLRKHWWRSCARRIQPTTPTK